MPGLLSSIEGTTQRQPHKERLQQWYQKQLKAIKEPGDRPTRTKKTNPREREIASAETMNGMNGGQMAANGMPGPSPAGHQAELNYIYGMVEELAKQLEDNRKATNDIVNGLGRVRQRARTQGQSNDEVINAAAEEINSQEENQEALISVLTESLEKAKFSRDQNAALLGQYAQSLTSMLRQFHEYKNKHLADTTAWHRSYRQQLDDARRENSKLREQIWEMQAHAGKANENLRKFREKYEDGEWERRVQSKAERQEKRFWRRMAMPEVESDDEEFWSGDDDVIDVAEKKRLAEIERRAMQEADGLLGEGESPGEVDELDGPLGGNGLMGGIAMQRDESGSGGSVQQAPARPGSAASSTGSSGA